MIFKISSKFKVLLRTLPTSHMMESSLIFFFKLFSRRVFSEISSTTPTTPTLRFRLPFVVFTSSCFETAVLRVKRICSPLGFSNRFPSPQRDFPLVKHPLTT
ncbi:MAG: hypothetical protein AMJ89_02045 [candidate division Zixibacteria bacterium SM23_73]|nr:MAG: hypothetical protein AMJ89_02045 [candidate division Zixibacteria bacterium SM23_73]